MERFEAHKEPHISMEEASEVDMDALIEIEKSVPKTNTYSPMVTERGWKRELAENTVLLIKSGETPVGSIAYTENHPDTYT